jgi:uncharacterized Fe-S cluster protein YjdI
VYLNYVGLGFVIELNYAGFVIDVYMCELVFVNHVNICGHVHELTQKTAQIYQISNSPKILPDLTKLQHPEKGAVLIL